VTIIDAEYSHKDISVLKDTISSLFDFFSLCDDGSPIIDYGVSVLVFGKDKITNTPVRLLVSSGFSWQKSVDVGIYKNRTPKHPQEQERSLVDADFIFYDALSFYTSSNNPPRTLPLDISVKLRDFFNISE